MKIPIGKNVNRIDMFIKCKYNFYLFEYHKKNYSSQHRGMK